MYLVDTNVISEARKGARANAGVLSFFRQGLYEQLYLSVQTLGELRRGVENVRKRGDHLQAARLEDWVALIVDRYGDRTLDFDIDCALIWGHLMSPDPSHAIDKQIAAIALSYNFRVVTRNVADFSATGVKVFNPFV